MMFNMKLLALPVRLNNISNRVWGQLYYSYIIVIIRNPQNPILIIQAP